jgi:hypothetical protein
MNDEALRRIYQEMLARDTAASPSPHVTPEEMLAVIERRASSAERLRILDRVMQSEVTRRDFELLRAAVAASRPRPGLAPRWAAAAAVLIVSAAGIVLWQTRPEQNVLRSGGDELTLTAPPDTPAASGPLVFAWRRIPRAVSYELELVDASGALVHLGSVSDTSWTPPDTLHLVPGIEYRWWVRATLNDGTVVEAPPRRLMLSP